MGVQNRTHYIDVLKGIGILFVLFGHMNNQIWTGYLYSFHMAIFFFISGLLINLEKYSTFKLFFFSRIKQLYIPYVIFYLLIYVYWLAVERPLRSVDVPPFDAFVGLFWGSDNMYWIFPAGVLWFVICLFSLEVLFVGVIKFVKGIYLQLAVLVGLTVLGIVMARQDWYVLPFSLNNALLSIPFLAVGYIMRNILFSSKYNHETIKKASQFLLYPFLIISVILFPEICEIGKETDISYLKFPREYEFYSVPFISIFLWLFISILIGHSRFIEYLGRNTLPLLAIHPQIARLCLFMANYLWGLSKNTIKGDLIYSLCLLVVVLLLCWPIIIIWGKVYPKIVSTIAIPSR